MSNATIRGTLLPQTIHGIPVPGSYTGITEHGELNGRDAADQHPISAITGLQSALDGKQPIIADLQTIRTNAAAVMGKADESDLTAHTGNSDIHVTAQDKSGWSAKYSKPGTGIPKTDLAAAVQTSLGKADSALQEAPTAEEVQYEPDEEHTEGSVAEALSSQFTAIAEKQDTLIAGENITIAEDGKTISAASGGTFDHTQLTNRDAADQHQISAITGLQTTLDEHNQAIDELGLSAILVDSNGRFYVNQEDE